MTTTPPSELALSCNFVKLAQECPDIQPLVRDLELRGRAATSKAWWEGAQTRDIPWPLLPTLPGNVPHPATRREPDAVEVLSWMRLTFSPVHGGVPPLLSLPNIHILRLSETTLSAESAAFFAEVFPGVHTLSINQCRVMSFAGLTALFQAFPRLRMLHLLAVEWLPRRPGGAVPDTACGSLANLTTLDLSRDICMEPLLDWLLKVSAHNTIRRLSCSIATRLNATAIRTFLKTSGSLLDHLSITLVESHDPTAILEATQLDLSACTGIQSLHIPCSRSRAEPSSRSLSWVLILLSKVPSPHLGEIRISIRPAELDRLNLEGLDVVLARNALSGLQSLTFDIDDTKAAPKFGVTRLEALLRQRVPTASAKGLVRLKSRY
ncbi:hypothetical protein GSI_02412 [Ganoderma sinense ZZ0214-1]|uniref:F-box domain-containing protein n=1 Tax=Ganoderma sinense ZZ0214-1 TaxID=1077348 RepID=A0A2G8SPK9_9APHY|nr:hypothetical protein GSI_02412 [Ganoderma sinense ZZ0214-1]